MVITKWEAWVSENTYFLEVDPRLATPPPLHSGSQGIAIYGDHPPALVDLNDLCPPQPSCPECADPRETRAHCREGGISLADLVGKLEIKPFGNETFPGLPNRTLGNFFVFIEKK